MLLQLVAVKIKRNIPMHEPVFEDFLPTDLVSINLFTRAVAGIFRLLTVLSEIDSATLTPRDSPGRIPCWGLDE
jgi:hypothetical protein